MNAKRTWTVAFVAALLFVGIWFFDSGSTTKEPEVRSIIPGLRAAAVTSVQIAPAGKFDIQAERTNSGWRLTRPVEYPAQETAVRNLLDALAQLKQQVFISPQDLKNQTNAAENYGFDKPQFTISLKGGGGDHEIAIGRNTGAGDQVYLRVVGAEGVNVVSADLLKLLPRDEKSWRDTSFVKVGDLAFDRLAVSSGANVMDLQRDPTGAWRLPQHSNARADSDKINELLFRLNTVSIARFVTDDPRADLESMGLQPPQVQLSFLSGTNQLLALQFGRANDDHLLYARRAGQNSVVLVSSDDIDPWRAPYQEFRDRRLMGPFAGALDSVEVRGAENFIVQRTNGAWVVPGPQGFPADAGATKYFIDMLAQLQVQVAKEVAPETAMTNYGLTPPSREYILRAASTNSAGVATNMIIAQLDFGAQQGGTIFARRADQPDESSVIYTAKTDDYDALPSKAIQLRERRIWDFDARDVPGVTIRVKGKVIKLGHAGPNNWIVTAGSANIIPNVVELAVLELGALSTVGWVDRGSQNNALYGIPERPADWLQISVDVVDGDQRKTLDLNFGKVTGDGTTYFATTKMPDGQYWVFLMPPKVSEDILEAFQIRRLVGGQ